MKRSEILCPECMKKKILIETPTKGYCDNCGTNFVITGEKSVRYA